MCFHLHDDAEEGGPVSRACPSEQSAFANRSQKGNRGRSGKKKFPKNSSKTLAHYLHLPDLRGAADWIRVPRLGIRVLAAMDGAGAEGELTAQETALYDRQIRVWGVDAQKRCAAAQELSFILILCSRFFRLCFY